MVGYDVCVLFCNLVGLCFACVVWLCLFCLNYECFVVGLFDQLILFVLLVLGSLCLALFILFG